MLSEYAFVVKIKKVQLRPNSLFQAGYMGIQTGVPESDQYMWDGLGELSKFYNNFLERIKQLDEGRVSYEGQPIDYHWNRQGMKDSKAIYYRIPLSMDPILESILKSKKYLCAYFYRATGSFCNYSFLFLFEF